MRAFTLLVLTACSGAPLPRDMQAAQAKEASRDDEGALAAYRAICDECEKSGRRRPHDDCALAAERSAEMNERLERFGEAYRYWILVPRLSAPQTGTTGRQLSERRVARALERTAELLAERLSRPSEALAVAWRVVAEFPDEVAADDALALALRLSGSNSVALQQKLAELWERLKKTDVADNILFARANLLAGSAAAVELYDQLAATYPHSGLFDDSLWRASEILRRAGDARGAILRLQKILDTHKDALITGSYNSLVLDDAQLLVGRIWLDDLHRPAEAVNAFQNLEDDFKDSVLRDDALLELARARLAQHDPATENDKKQACESLAKLFREYPNGNMVRRAHDEAARLACP